MPEEIFIGGFIAARRREKNLTQKQLADLLGVTDKAVSKWERDGGYPDVTLLTPLAACLGVSVGELLAGTRQPGAGPAPEPPKPTAGGKVRRSVGDWLAFSLTVCCVLAIGVCMICDFSINGAFTWVVTPASSILFGWAVLIPFCRCGGARLTMSLASASLFLLPFLFVLARTTGGGWFFPVAVPISLACLACLWVLRLVWSAGNGSPYFLAAASLGLLPFVDLTVDFVLWRYLMAPMFSGWDVLGIIMCLLCAGLLFYKGRLAAA